MFFNDELLEKAKEAYRKIKWVGIVVSILMILLGIAVFFIPESAGIILMFLMAIGMVIRGAADIIMFCQAPKGTRNGWMLAGGIAWAIIAAFLIVGYLKADYIGKLFLWGNIEMVIGFMVGFTSIFSAVNAFCSIREIKAMGGSAAGPILSGILGILVGMICLTYPIGSVITLTIFYSVFLIAGGISMLCLFLSYKK
ncbi:MAG: DUF308 domain-containing protein [Lachnospiraceae bacterium]|nr:DUF308 domain-containing protein [Lachnospiraceae bacterium]